MCDDESLPRFPGIDVREAGRGKGLKAKGGGTDWEGWKGWGKGWRNKR
jgi:hypothetical protein